jgi:hypothetical protein
MTTREMEAHHPSRPGSTGMSSITAPDCGQAGTAPPVGSASVCHPSRASRREVSAAHDAPCTPAADRGGIPSALRRYDSGKREFFLPCR